MDRTGMATYPLVRRLHSGGQCHSAFGAGAKILMATGADGRDGAAPWLATERRLRVDPFVTTSPSINTVCDIGHGYRPDGHLSFEDK